MQKTISTGTPEQTGVIESSRSAPAANPSKTLTIGPYQLPHPFVQAALSGYSDWPMRALAKRYGASYTLAEVMLERFVSEVKGTGKTEHHLYVGPDDHPVGAQLMGSDPLRFGPAAQRLVQAGFDVIDINFGCPVRTAMGGCRGGFHLSQPEIALEIIQRVREAVPAHLPVTIKMRRGIDDSTESCDNFFQILDGAFDRGVSAITVHGRTVEQKYIGPSNWDFLRQVKEHAGERTILGSGDLFTAQACVDMLEKTGLNGVTIARGAIGNPWIFEQANALWQGKSLPAPPTVFEQRQAIEEHQALAEHTYGPTRWLGVLRKFTFKYARLHPQARELRVILGQLKSESDWNQLLTRFYTVDQPGVPPEVDEVNPSNQSEHEA